MQKYFWTLKTKQGIWTYAFAFNALFMSALFFYFPLSLPSLSSLGYRVTHKSGILVRLEFLCSSEMCLSLLYLMLCWTPL